MDIKTAEKLCELNTRFYRENAASFSETRVAPWPGWKRCLELARADEGARDTGRPDAPLRVFDLACGNLRFESYLAQELSFEAYAVDNCEGLVPEMEHVRFRNLDVVDTLLHGEGTRLNQLYDAPRAHLSACFGFMHHVPMRHLREEVLRSLVDQTVPGGLVCVSFWAFMNNAQLAAKAQETHAQGMADLGLSDFEEGDYLLGWKNKPGVYRYCHHFGEEEVGALAASVADKADVVARFLSDGRTNDMNSYLVLKVR